MASRHPHNTKQFRTKAPSLAVHSIFRYLSQVCHAAGETVKAGDYSGMLTLHSCCALTGSPRMLITPVSGWHEMCITAVSSTLPKPSSCLSEQHLYSCVPVNPNNTRDHLILFLRPHPPEMPIKLPLPALEEPPHRPARQELHDSYCRSRITRVQLEERMDKCRVASSATVRMGVGSVVEKGYLKRCWCDVGQAVDLEFWHD